MYEQLREVQHIEKCKKKILQLNNSQTDYHNPIFETLNNTLNKHTILYHPPPPHSLITPTTPCVIPTHPPLFRSEHPHVLFFLTHTATASRHQSRNSNHLSLPQNRLQAPGKQPQSK
jgi:hypothetical protein